MDFPITDAPFSSNSPLFAEIDILTFQVYKLIPFTVKLFWEDGN